MRWTLVGVSTSSFECCWCLQALRGTSRAGRPDSFLWVLTYRRDSVIWSFRPVGCQTASTIQRMDSFFYSLCTFSTVIHQTLPPLCCTPTFLVVLTFPPPNERDSSGFLKCEKANSSSVCDVSARAWSHDSCMCKPYLHVCDAASGLRACAVNKGAAERWLSPYDLRVPRILHFIKTYVWTQQLRLSVNRMILQTESDETFFSWTHLLPRSIHQKIARGTQTSSVQLKTALHHTF